MNGLHVSASALRLLGDCPRAFSYRYIAGHQPEDVGSPLVLGRAIHEALAQWLLRLRDGTAEASFEDLLATAVASIDQAKEGPTPIALDDDEDLVAEAARLLRAFMATPLRPKRVIAVELPFTIAIGRHPITNERFGYEELIAGVFDLVTEDAEGVAVIDHKITSRRPAIDGGVDLQMAIYALAAAEIFQPEKPVRLFHHVLTRTKVPRVELCEIPRSSHDTAEALEAVASGLELIHAAIGHSKPGRLLGRHRTWKCGSCSWRRRCSEDRT